MNAMFFIMNPTEFRNINFSRFKIREGRPTPDTKNCFSWTATAGSIGTICVWYTQVIPPTCKSLNLNLTRSGHWEVLDMTAKKIGHPTHSPSCETFKIRATCPKWWCRRIPLRNNGAQLKVQWSPRVVRMASINLLVMVSGSNRFLSNTSASLSVFRGFELFKRLGTELDNDVDFADVFWRPFLLSEFTWDLF